MLDGSQHLFVILNVKAEDAVEKPFFSFDYIKKNDGSEMHGVSTLDDLEYDPELLKEMEMDE